MNIPVRMTTLLERQLKLITTSRHVIYQDLFADLQVIYRCGDAIQFLGLAILD
jgi:hypothetical protein